MLAEEANSQRGPATPRIDGREKVTGDARYGSDFAPGALAWAFLKTSPIAKGRIVDFDERAARAVPGVLAILTYRDVGELVRAGKTMSDEGYMGSSIQPLASDQIMHAGQIVAVVVAESFENAREAVRLFSVQYEAERPSASFDDPGVTVGSDGKEDPKVGDFATAFVDAPVKVDAQYETATQHHNPIELFSTVAAWDAGKLTVWESSQNVWGFKNGLAEQLNMSADDIRVVSPFVGGAFGSRGSLTQRTALIAFAARRIGRPVKLVATRDQGFTIATYRAETRHHIQLGSRCRRQARCLQSRGLGGYLAARRLLDRRHRRPSTRLYACPNVASKVSIVHADRNTLQLHACPGGDALLVRTRIGHRRACLTRSTSTRCSCD